MPLPTGVVNGPLMPTWYSLNAVTVSSGNQSLNFLNAVSPANTSSHSILRLAPYAFCTAASNTRSLAAQMSGPVPSPRIKGIVGLSGTWRLPCSMEIFAIVVRMIAGCGRAWQARLQARARDRHTRAVQACARADVERLAVGVAERDIGRAFRQGDLAGLLAG